MARRKSNQSLTIDERIEEISALIAEAEESVKTLKQQKKVLEKEKSEKEKEQLYAVLKEHNITIDKLQEILSNQE